MKLLYFAWVRTRIGVAVEDVTPPAEVRDVAGLMTWLGTRSPGHAAALANPSLVRVAVNQVYAKPGQPVGADDEVALFPPVTGG